MAQLPFPGISLLGCFGVSYHHSPKERASFLSGNSIVCGGNSIIPVEIAKFLVETASFLVVAASFLVEIASFWVFLEQNESLLFSGNTLPQGDATWKFRISCRESCPLGCFLGTVTPSSMPVWEIQLLAGD